MLHVVLFPPEPGCVTRGAGGREIPIIALLPLLHRALEEFAADEAVESLANRPLAGLPDELGALPATELATLLHRYPRARWRQKAHYARMRVERLGWEAACHHAALEILGYRFNRAPMLRIAGERSLAEWAEGNVDPEMAFAAEKGNWSLQGVRPANHPLTRLTQYASWTGLRADWPARVLDLGARLPAVNLAASTPILRRQHHFHAWRDQISETICARTISGTRLNNLICDGVLPLLDADSGCELGGLWYHWICGDLPPWLTSGLRQLGFFDGRAQPACHGAAQGLLGWFLERETRR
jgi:hypothetical protein